MVVEVDNMRLIEKLPVCPGTTLISAITQPKKKSQWMLLAETSPVTFN